MKFVCKLPNSYLIKLDLLIRPMPFFVSKRKTGDLSHSKFDCFFFFFAFNLRPGFPCQTRNENSQKQKGFDGDKENGAFVGCRMFG